MLIISNALVCQKLGLCRNAFDSNHSQQLPTNIDFLCGPVWEPSANHLTLPISLVNHHTSCRIKMCYIFATCMRNGCNVTKFSNRVRCPFESFRFHRRFSSVVRVALREKEAVLGVFLASFSRAGPVSFDVSFAFRTNEKGDIFQMCVC